MWVFEGQQVPNVGLNAVAGRPPDEYGLEPTALDQLREGNFDIHRRIDDMNAAGILGSMCFPSMTGFCGELFGKQDDKQLARAMIEARSGRAALTGGTISLQAESHPIEFRNIAVRRGR